MDSKYKAKEKLCEYLINRINDCASGSGNGEDGEYCLYERPRNTYFIGSLSCLPEENEGEFTEKELLSDFFSKLSPYALGFECKVRKFNSNPIISIKPKMNLYYRIVPTITQQKKLNNHRKLVVVYKRIMPEFPFININLSDLINNKKIVIKSNNKPFASVLNDIYNIINSDPKLYRTEPSKKIKQNTDDYDREFYKLINEATNGETVNPDWRFEIHVELKKIKSDKYNLQFILVNTSIDSDPEGKDKIEDTYLFDVSLEAQFKSLEIIPYNFYSLEDSYRYNREMPAVGLNCCVEFLEDDKGLEGLKTVYAPIMKQKRYGTRKYLPEEIGGREITNLSFEHLSKKPIPILNSVLRDMKDYLMYWEDNKEKFINDERYEDIFYNDYSRFKEEIDRFERGIKLLKNEKYNILKKAFMLMNKTFLKKEQIISKGYSSWRPFQIVFIVTQLYDLAAFHWIEDFSDNTIDSPEVLWFPTGGGKTEAYMGLVVLNAFFDRLRGKTTGLTALLRFPLRLLSAQQLERLTAILGAAQLVKKAENITGDTFSVGLWVGNQTPNNIFKKNEADNIANDPKIDALYKKIQTCPFCGKDNIHMEFDYSNWRLVHVCNADDCPWSGNPLPIYIVDNEIYRYLPTAVVSTVDKIALSGYQNDFANIMGGVSYKCDIHGYSWQQKCWECNKDREIIDGNEKKYMTPTLEIQDELHLVKEELGAFDSHYESFINKMQEEISGSYPWKVIASTATIKKFDYHVNHLYCRGGEPHRFPVPGPSWVESFYSSTDSNNIGRFFVGIMPHYKTHINSIVDLLWLFHREIQRLRNLNPSEFIKTIRITEPLNKQVITNILDQYEVSLNYVLTKKGGDQVAESISGQINKYLRRDGYQPIKNEMMTGGTTGEKIISVLNEMQEDYKQLKAKDRIKSLTATSMISHGVDIDRLNFMVFFGMPRQTSEYIQASSRVGRKSPGISFICFAPARERDRSHYTYFKKYHEYTDRLVEPPAINRWSKYSIKKTLPGIFSAFMLNKYSRIKGKSIYKKRVWYEVVNELDDCEIDQIKRYLYDSYKIEHPLGDNFKLEIDQAVDEFIYNLLYEARTESFPESLSPNPQIKPMRSLRDTDEPVKFIPNRGESFLLNKLK